MEQTQKFAHLSNEIDTAQDKRAGIISNQYEKLRQLIEIVSDAMSTRSYEKSHKVYFLHYNLF